MGRANALATWSGKDRPEAGQKYPARYEIAGQDDRQTRLPELDIARGAAVLLVTLLHASLAFPDTPVFHAINTLAGGVRMPLLLFVTGYLFMTTSAIDKRLIQFGWIFAVWTLIAAIAQFVGNGEGHLSTHYFREFVQPTSIMWFVWASGLMGLSLIVLRRTHPAIVLVLAGVCSMSNEAGLLRIEAYSHEHMIETGFFFYLGAYYGPAILKFIRTDSRRIFILGPPLMLAMRGIDYWAFHSLGWQVIGIGERVAAIVFALAVARSLAAKASAVAAPLVWVGRNTMPIYVAHSLFIVPFAPMVVGMLPEASIVLLTGLIIVASLALHRAALSARWTWLYAAPRWLVEAPEAKGEPEYAPSEPPLSSRSAHKRNLTGFKLLASRMARQSKS